MATKPESTPTPKAFPLIAADDAAKAIIFLATPTAERRMLVPAEATAADVKAMTTAAKETVLLATAAYVAGLPCPVAGQTFRADNGDTCNGGTALRRLSGLDSKAFGRIVGRIA